MRWSALLACLLLVSAQVMAIAADYSNSTIEILNYIADGAEPLGEVSLKEGEVRYIDLDGRSRGLSRAEAGSVLEALSELEELAGDAQVVYAEYSGRELRMVLKYADGREVRLTRAAPAALAKIREVLGAREGGVLLGIPPNSGHEWTVYLADDGRVVLFALGNDIVGTGRQGNLYRENGYSVAIYRSQGNFSFAVLTAGGGGVVARGFASLAVRPVNEEVYSTALVSGGGVQEAKVSDAFARAVNSLAARGVPMLTTVVLVLPAQAGEAGVLAQPEEKPVGEEIERTNAEFRKAVMERLNRMAREQGFAGVKDFVMVSPHSVMRSPVALLSGVEELPLKELEKGRDIVLADFCIPEGSEIPSGTYVMRVEKEGKSWVAELRSLDGRVVLRKEAIFEQGPFMKGWPGRNTGIFSNNYGVRFGAQLREGAFYVDIKLGKGRLNPEACSDITEELRKFRSRVEGAFGERFKSSGDLFIATRSDSLLVAGLGDGEVVAYLRAPGVKAGFYRISPASGRIASAAGGEPAGEFRELEKYSGLEAGLIGGMLGERLSLGYVGTGVRSFEVALGTGEPALLSVGGEEPEPERRPFDHIGNAPYEAEFVPFSTEKEFVAAIGERAIDALLGRGTVLLMNSFWTSRPPGIGTLMMESFWSSQPPAIGTNKLGSAGNVGLFALGDDCAGTGKSGNLYNKCPVVLSQELAGSVVLSRGVANASPPVLLLAGNESGMSLFALGNDIIGTGRQGDLYSAFPVPVERLLRGKAVFLGKEVSEEEGILLVDWERGVKLFALGNDCIGTGKSGNLLSSCPVVAQRGGYVVLTKRFLTEAPPGMVVLSARAEKPEAKKARPERPEKAPAKQPLPAKGVCGPTLLSLLAVVALACRRRVR